MKKRHAICGAAFFLANVATGPAQTDPGLSIKPAGVTLSGEKIGPEKAPVDWSRPEPEATDFFATEEEKEFLRAAADGQVWAQARLGIIYVNTPDDNARMELGRGMLEHAASQDSPDALFELAKMALAGRGMARSPSTAFGHMKRAAELGLPEAEYEIASMYSEGRGTTKDQVAALEWARKAAANSLPKAAVAVGMIMLQSRDNATQSEGLEMIDRAAASGNKEAIIILATAYAQGHQGVAKDEKRAEGLLMPPAQEGDAECQFALASLYKFGDTFTARRDEAQMWLHRAADQGHAKALEILSSGKIQRPAEAASPAE